MQAESNETDSEDSPTSGGGHEASDNDATRRSVERTRPEATSPRSTVGVTIAIALLSGLASGALGFLAATQTSSSETRANQELALQAARADAYADYFAKLEEYHRLLIQASVSAAPLREFMDEVDGPNPPNIRLPDFAIVGGLYTPLTQAQIRRFIRELPPRQRDRSAEYILALNLLDDANERELALEPMRTRANLYSNEETLIALDALDASTDLVYLSVFFGEGSYQDAQDAYNGDRAEAFELARVEVQGDLYGSGS